MFLKERLCRGDRGKRESGGEALNLKNCEHVLQIEQRIAHARQEIRGGRNLKEKLILILHGVQCCVSLVFFLMFIYLCLFVLKLFRPGKSKMIQENEGNWRLLLFGQ
jgi:hypothetical protein